MTRNTPIALAALTTMMFLLAPAPAAGSLPDLCDDVYLDDVGAPATDSKGVALSRFCTWTGPDAPLWADHVCCAIDGASADCTPTDANGRCTAGMKMWCDYGEDIGGKVTCYQPFPDACDEGFCDTLAVPPGTQAEEMVPLCCYADTDDCYQLAIGAPCGGDFLYCDSPYTTEQGTVGCADFD